MDQFSQIMNDQDDFQVMIDVRNFQPNEIKIKIVNVLFVEGKHGEREDGTGTVSRHFVRKDIIPDDCDLDQMKSDISQGFLSVNIPRKTVNISVQNSHSPSPELATDKRQRVIGNHSTTSFGSTNV